MWTKIKNRGVRMLLHQISNSIGNYNYNAYTYNNRIWPIHFHSNYELVYSAKGTTEVTVNGISNFLAEGELILISPYSPHSLNISKNTYTWVGVFSKDYIYDFANKYMFTNFSVFECDACIKEFLENNLFNCQETEHYLLTACLNLICSQLAKKGACLTQNNNDDFVKKVVIYITENIQNAITQKKTACALNYEYHYFSSLFHKYFAINFSRFVNIFRFEQACYLLLKEDITVTETCNKCGFGSIRNFNRVFKEFSGQTPIEYKNKSHKTHHL